MIYRCRELGRARATVRKMKRKRMYLGRGDIIEGGFEREIIMCIIYQGIR